MPSVNYKLLLVLFLIVLAAISGILFYFSQSFAYIASVLALVAAILGGASILIGALDALLHKSFEADFLASIAIIASIISEEYLAAAVVAIMLYGGELLEDYASEKATSAIEKLVKSTPQKATILRSGIEIEVPVQDIRLDDVVIVKSGEKIPVDGVVIKGQAAVDEATITGESLPVEKIPGSQVYGNTILELGALEVKVTKIGEDTTFAHIVRLVREAQTRRAPIERLADKYAKWFAPIILVIAVATFSLTKDVLRTVSILVIACPCALVLATPVAVIAGIANAAKKGIIIRGGQIIEKVAKVNAIAIDKTGTLTISEPQVVTIKAIKGKTEEEIVALAYTAEKLSEHPLARAIIRKAKELDMSVANPSTFHVSPGSGVIAEQGNRRIVVGNRRLIEGSNIQIDEDLDKYAKQEEEDGRTALFIAENDDVAGIIGIADTLKANVSSCIESLRESGIEKIFMLTGDNPHVAWTVAKQAGIKEVEARALPEQKVACIQKVKEDGYTVAMIGDGINDAPALASADVGIAMGMTGTDIAIETAGVILTTDDLTKVEKTIRLSKAALRIIRLNIVFSLVINVLGILLSSVGAISPILASVIHESNALFVVLNSVRLLWLK